MNRRVRASEIGAFAYCARAWGYAERGEPSQRQPQRDAGQAHHSRRLRRASLSAPLLRIGLACLALALALVVLALRA